MKHLLRLYNVKRRVKNFLRENKALLEKTGDESILEVDIAKKMKKSTDRKSQRDLKKTKTLFSSRIPASVKNSPRIGKLIF
jgi:hypothetical protein